MHERLRTRGTALVVTMIVVVVFGTGGGLAVSDLTPGATSDPVHSFQSENASDGESDDAATETATDVTETSTPDSEAADGSGETADSAATDTETQPATDASTSESTGDADADEPVDAGQQVDADEETDAGGEAGSNDDAPDENETAGDGTNATDGADTTDDGTEAANESNASTGTLASCSQIDEPGQYELTADVSGGSGTCLAVQSSDVVLDGNGHTVAGSGGGTGIQVAGGTSNVTVRNVDVSDWTVAVELGGSGASGPQANLVEVRATGSDTGVRLDEADDSAMQSVTARDNGDGIVLVDTAGVRASDVTVDGNDGTGLWLARDVSDSSFSIVQATGNGDRGIYVSTATVDNFVGDATVTDNGGPGVEFADSSNNVLADSRVAENDGPGVLSYPAGGDRLENVELSGNGDGAYRDRSEIDGAVGDTVRLQDGASVQFDQGVTHLAFVGTPQSLPEETDAAGPAVDVTLRDGATATVTVPVDASGDVTAYQRVDGNWEERTDVTVTNGEAEITVSGSGVVVPVVETSDDDSTTGTDGDTVRADTSSNDEPATNDASLGSDETDPNEGSGPAADTASNDGAAASEPADSGATDRAENGGHVLVIGPMDEDTSIDYTLQVDGTVSKVTDGSVAADANDSVSRTNGTVTVTGTTSSADAYVVDGELLQVDPTADVPGFFLRYGASIGGNETRP